jgi:capsular exopolysaccharide synthesis family protein
MKPPQNPPPNNQPGNNQPPGKGDGKNTGYAGYSTYGDYGTYGYGSGYGTGYGGYGAPGGYGQGGGYSGYYYGYGYGYGGNQGGGEPTQTRNIRDYLVILRERIWYLLLTFFVIFGAFVLYWFNATPLYSATASLQVLRQSIGAGQLLSGGGSQDPLTTMTDPTEFNTRVRLMETRDIATRVANMMTEEEKRQFLLPYKSNNPLAPETRLEDRLLKSRTIQPGRLAYIMQVSIEHPNPDLAATVADYYVQAFIEFNQSQNVEKAARSVEVLKENARQQQKKIQDLQTQMNNLVERYGKDNLSRESNTLPSVLASWTGIEQQNKDALDAYSERWKLVQQYQDEKKPLWDLSFIAADTHVSTLKSNLSDAQVSISGLAQSFGPNHPDMKALVERKTRVESELTDAVNSAAAKVHTDYLQALAKYNSADAEVKSIKDEMKDLSIVQNQYDTLLSEKETTESMLKQMQNNIEQQTFKVLDNSENYLPVDKAKGMVVQTQPKTLLLIFGGILSGLMGGIGMAFLVAFLDDRIKSAFDIESYVGLPLIGILPRIAHLNANEKAQAVASNADRRITEAFRSIYSSLKLNDASKNARVILVTSTVPSEGKSFMTTNLALTYAMHAERVLLVDCDLRMPNIAKSLGREINDQGLMTHLREGRPFEECIVKDYYPGLDVMPTGGRTNNPTQIFNSREFADFVTRMRQQYDRVFIDSPPLGAVSDALSLLPNVDGVLYVIKFNTVKRKVAKVNLTRLMQGNVPVFGAILNQISLASASYYYTHYYDKSYHNYYMREGEHQAEGDAAAQAHAQPTQQGASEQSSEQK